MISRHRVPKYKRSVPRDRFFHLPTALAVNDPFLRRLYGVVIDVLDDHPYPSTPDEFRLRTREIKRDVQNLNLPPDQQQFIQRIMSDTGVSVVSIFLGTKKFRFDLYFRSIYGKVLISLHWIKGISMAFGLNYQVLGHVFHRITDKFQSNNMGLVFMIINYSLGKQLPMVQHGFKWKLIVLNRIIFTMILIMLFIMDKIFSNIVFIV